MVYALCHICIQEFPKKYLGFHKLGKGADSTPVLPFIKKIALHLLQP